MDDLDRILSDERAIVPAPEFTAAVMAAVHRRADAPSPLPVPWRRAALGGGICLTLTLAALALAIKVILHQGAPSGTGLPLTGIDGMVLARLRDQFASWPPTVPAMLLWTLAGSFLAIRLSLRPARE